MTETARVDIGGQGDFVGPFVGDEGAVGTLDETLFAFLPGSGFRAPVMHACGQLDNLALDRLAVGAGHAHS